MRVSVVIPALNEESTVAGVVETCLASCAEEVLVVDSDSTDATAPAARAAGARVLNWREIAPEIAPRPGKGEALWRGVLAARGDVVVFVDADVTSLRPEWVDKLAAPIAHGAHLVKASYSRGFEGRTSGGGRVTELTAKPLIRQLFPELSHIDQPLAGEYAIRRESALTLPFVAGYGVESGLLVDVATRFGPDAVTQVGLGVRMHRNRTLEELAPMADVVTRTLLARAGWAGAVEQRPPWRRDTI
ncbi:glucosyl-3-phosphoglycerate synthase [Corynebacterium timonense]|uniref:Glucosyl-3-phosphoglycerate synthase n=1 Tax=Corynebacterium timonense TaxID=441500 RepID=A0A1H1QEN2_9CORY|nr:glucosyl-3-phosphoglycerate synthase [Corynebacterium timonense]SDS21932.1 glucosyl-3-phosphoglycerate synthase [Corynebacterium timonense]